MTEETEWCGDCNGTGWVYPNNIQTGCKTCMGYGFNALALNNPKIKPSPPVNPKPKSKKTNKHSKISDISNNDSYESQPPPVPPQSMTSNKNVLQKATSFIKPHRISTDETTGVLSISEIFKNQAENLDGVISVAKQFAKYLEKMIKIYSIYTVELLKTSEAANQKLSMEKDSSLLSSLTKGCSLMFSNSFTHSKNSNEYLSVLRTIYESLLPIILKANKKITSIKSQKIKRTKELKSSTKKFEKSKSKCNHILNEHEIMLDNLNKAESESKGDSKKALKMKKKAIKLSKQSSSITNEAISLTTNHKAIIASYNDLKKDFYNNFVPNLCREMVDDERKLREEFSILVKDYYKAEKKFHEKMKNVYAGSEEMISAINANEDVDKFKFDIPVYSDDKIIVVYDLPLTVEQLNERCRYPGD